MTRTRALRTASIGLTGALALGAAVSAANAQSMGVDPRALEARENVRPPDPGDPAGSNSFIIYGAVILLGGVALGLCLLPSRRGHQD